RGLSLPVILISFILVLLGRHFQTLHFDSKLFIRIATIPVWGLAQQYIAQSFINRRLQNICGKGWMSILLTGLIFALIHLPNLPLAAATLLAGLIWARQFQLTPNLYAIALTHGFLSALFSESLPKSLLHNMVVGLNYYQK